MNPSLLESCQRRVSPRTPKTNETDRSDVIGCPSYLNKNKKVIVNPYLPRSKKRVFDSLGVFDTSPSLSSTPPSLQNALDERTLVTPHDPLPYTSSWAVVATSPPTKTNLPQEDKEDERTPKRRTVDFHVPPETMITHPPRLFPQVDDEVMEDPLYTSWSWVDSSPRVYDDNDDDNDEEEDGDIMESEETTDEGSHDIHPQDHRMETLAPLATPQGHHEGGLAVCPLFVFAATRCDEHASPPCNEEEEEVELGKTDQYRSRFISDPNEEHSDVMAGVVVVERTVEDNVYAIDGDLTPDMNNRFDDEVSCSQDNEDVLGDATISNSNNTLSLLIPLWHLVLFLLPIYAIVTTLLGMTSDPKRRLGYVVVYTHCPLVSNTLFHLEQGSIQTNDYLFAYCQAEDSFLKLLLGDMWLRTASQDNWSLLLKRFQSSWMVFPLYLVLLPTLVALPYAAMVLFLRKVEYLLLNHYPHHKEKAFRPSVARFLNGFLYSAFEFPFGILRHVCQWSWWGLVTMPYSYYSSLRRAVCSSSMDSSSTSADPMTTRPSCMTSLWTRGWKTTYEVIATMTFTSLLCRMVRLATVWGWWLAMNAPPRDDQNNYKDNNGSSSLRHYFSATHTNYKNLYQWSPWKKDQSYSEGGLSLFCWESSIGEMMIGWQQTMASRICALVHLIQQEYDHYHATNNTARMVLTMIGGLMGIMFWVWLPGILLGTSTWMIRTWQRRRRLCGDEQRQTLVSS